MFFSLICSNHSSSNDFKPWKYVSGLPKNVVVNYIFFKKQHMLIQFDLVKNAAKKSLMRTKRCLLQKGVKSSKTIFLDNLQEQRLPGPDPASEKLGRRAPERLPATKVSNDSNDLSRKAAVVPLGSQVSLGPPRMASKRVCNGIYHMGENQWKCTKSDSFFWWFLHVEIVYTLAHLKKHWQILKIMPPCHDLGFFVFTSTSR